MEKLFVDIYFILCMLKSVHCKIDPFRSFDCHRKPFIQCALCAIEAKIRVNKKKKPTYIHVHMFKISHFYSDCSLAAIHIYFARPSLHLTLIHSLSISHKHTKAIFAHFCVWGLLPQHDFIFSIWQEFIRYLSIHIYCCRQQQRMKIAHRFFLIFSISCLS